MHLGTTCALYIVYNHVLCTKLIDHQFPPPHSIYYYLRRSCAILTACTIVIIVCDLVLNTKDGHVEWKVHVWSSLLQVYYNQSLA